jgi:hypothetical protein
LDIQEALLEKLHQYEKWPFLVYGLPGGIKREEQHKHGGYIIFIQAVKVAEQVRSQLTQLKTTAGWNSGAYFVIVVMSDLDHLFGNVLAEDILTEFWNEKIINTAVLLPASDSSKIRFKVSTEGVESMELVALLEVYAFFPYQTTNKCGNVIHASLLDYWVRDDSVEGRFLRNVALFTSKIPANLQGCTLSVSALELETVIVNRKSAYDDGLEMILLNTILSHMNVSAVFLPQPPNNEKWGRYLSNGSWDGIIGSVAKRKSDIAIGGIVVYSTRIAESVDVTSSYFQHGLYWYIPCAKALPYTMTITRVFTAAVWLRIVLIYIIVSALMWYFNKFASKSSDLSKNIQQAFITCLLNLWAVMLGISASLHISNFATIRMLYILWIFYSLALNTVYQAFLTTYLVDPGFKKLISTEEELIQSGLELGINPYFEASEDTFRSRYPNTIPCPDTVKCLRRLAEKGDLAVLSPYLLGEYMGTFNFSDSNGNPAYCRLDEQFATVNMVMLMQKGDPLLHYFNKVILSVLEAGLFDHWWSDLKHNAILSSNKTFLTTPSMEFKTLTKYHLQSCFYTQCLGHVLSLGVFVCEVITQFYKRA